MDGHYFKTTYIAAVGVFVVLNILGLWVARIPMATSSTIFRPSVQVPGLIGLLNETDLKAHCCKISNEFTLEQLCRENGNGLQLMGVAKRARTLGCTCVDFFYCKLVVVSAFSWNHYDEAQDMIASVQKYLPNTKLIVYDLGLTVKQKKQLQQYCKVEVRPFVFEKYPPHTKNLKEYAWKPLIAMEVTHEYEVMFWGDSSVRLKAPLFEEKVFPLLLKFPFVGACPTGLPIVPLTHDGMLQYLNLSLSREQLFHFGHLQSGCWIVWSNTLMRTKLLNYWADCALHKECIAPHGAQLRCTDKEKFRTAGTNTSGAYVGCHRYDQSALDMILIREFGLKVWDLAVHKVETSAVLRVERRGVTHDFSVKVCNDTELLF